MSGFMSALIEIKLHGLRLGLALAALFSWLLSFPLFGRFLAETAEENTLVLGLSFVTMHAAGLLVLHMLPPKAATACLPVRLAGGVIAALTTVYAFTYGLLIVDLLIMSALGLAAAFLVLAWVSRLAEYTSPLPALAVAMVGANLVFSITNMPIQMPKSGSLLLLAMLALAGAFLFQPAVENEDTKSTLVKKEESAKTIKALITFAVAIYFVGGIWHHTITLQLSVAPLWEKTIGSLIYAGAIVLFALIASRGQPANLAYYSLSALGVGLVIDLIGLTNPVFTLAYFAAHNLGFAAADLFYWYALWFLGKLHGTRRVFGLVLGFSLLLIVFSIFLSVIDWSGGYSPMLVKIALAMLFLAISLMYRFSFQFLNLSFMELPEPNAGSGTDALALPEKLTPSESQVYLHLMQGASDAEIADRLFVTRHTIKYHTSNILRKLEAKNRRELLADLATGRLKNRGRRVSENLENMPTGSSKQAPD